MIRSLPANGKFFALVFLLLAVPLYPIVSLYLLTPLPSPISIPLLIVS